MPSKKSEFKANVEKVFEGIFPKIRMEYGIPYKVNKELEVFKNCTSEDYCKNEKYLCDVKDINETGFVKNDAIKLIEDNAGAQALYDLVVKEVKEEIDAQIKRQPYKFSLPDDKKKQITLEMDKKLNKLFGGDVFEHPANKWGEDFLVVAGSDPIVGSEIIRLPTEGAKRYKEHVLGALHDIVQYAVSKNYNLLLEKAIEERKVQAIGDLHKVRDVINTKLSSMDTNKNATQDSIAEAAIRNFSKTLNTQIEEIDVEQKKLEDKLKNLTDKTAISLAKKEAQMKIDGIIYKCADAMLTCDIALKHERGPLMNFWRSIVDMLKSLIGKETPKDTLKETYVNATKDLPGSFFASSEQYKERLASMKAASAVQAQESQKSEAVADQPMPRTS